MNAAGTAAGQAASGGGVVGLQGMASSAAPVLTDIEIIRRDRYLIRNHYANPSQNDDGIVSCPLYYASIDGLGALPAVGSGGASGSSPRAVRSIAALKSLPTKNAPPDYVMSSPANFVPLACEYDVGCMVNDFDWMRLTVEAEGEVDERLTALGQRFFLDSEKAGSLTVNNLLARGAAAGDAYIKARRDPAFKGGVRFDLAAAEYVFPRFSPWDERIAQGYRLVYENLPYTPGSGDAPPVSNGTGVTYVEDYTLAGVQVYRDGVLVPEKSGPYVPTLDELPIAHVAHRDSDGFFGTPAVDGDLIAAIDNLNVCCSHIDNVMHQSYGNPILLLIGAPKRDSIAWGERMVLGLPKDTKAEILHFEGVTDLLKQAEDKDRALRARIVQLVLQELRSAAALSSGVALAMRLFAYDAYLAKLEKQYTKVIADAVRIGFKLLGVWPKGKNVEVKLDWGTRFPQDVVERIKEMEASVKLFGKVRPVVERYARQAGFSESDVAEIAANLARENAAELAKKETDAAGGGLAGAHVAAKARGAAAAPPTSTVLPVPAQAPLTAPAPAPAPPAA